MGTLNNKVALVTGAARGSGAAIAAKFIAEGARVILCDVNDDAGQEVAQRLGSAARYASLDITNEEHWQSVVEQTLQDHARIDVLVNNAAVLHLGAITNTSAETYKKVFEVNTLGAYLGMRAVIKTMQKQGSGSIVNIGSVDSLSGLNGASAYCSSKWALRGLTKSAALELGRDGIRVNLVCPASGNPEMFSPWFEQLSERAEATMEYINARALPRGGEPEELAEAVAFFASDASRYCTGADLAVDGGLTAGHHIKGFSSL